MRASTRLLLLALLPPLIACSRTVERTIVRPELADHRGATVRTVRLENGALVDFRESGGAIEGEGTSLLVRGRYGSPHSIPATSIVEAEIEREAFDAPKSMVLLASIVGVGALLFAGIAVPK